MKRAFIILMLMLSSCSPMVTQTPTTQLPAEDSIFSGSNCALPCWYGITIGKTTKQELLDILKSVSVVNQDSITAAQSAALFDEYVFFTIGKGPRVFKVEGGGTVKVDYLGTGEISILNDRVARIEFAGDLNLTIQHVVDIFGEPSYVIPFDSPGRGVQVELLSPTRGVDYSYSTDDLDSELTPNTKIDELIMFDITLYDEMIENKRFLFSIFRDPDDLEKYVWKGYGKISMYWYIK